MFYSNTSRHSNVNHKTRLSVESLENRDLLAANIVGNVLQVVGTNGPDTIRIAQQASNVAVTINNMTQTFALNGIGSMEVYAFDGNDTIMNDTSINMTAAAGAGNDYVRGGPAQLEVIYGEAGDDTIEGRDGVDVVYAGSGNDFVDGGNAVDYIYGEAGTDYLYGGVGNDYIAGGEGNDWLYGYTGIDSIYGEGGDDLIFGEGDKDYLWGGNGNDAIYGNSGDDILDGGAGNDALFGGDGYDLIYGSTGDDYLDAGANGGYLHGGAGYDMDAANWAPGGAKANDVQQPTAAPTCWLLAGMSSMVNNGMDLTSSARIHSLGNGRYEVQLYNGTQWKWIEVAFTGPVNATDPRYGVIDSGKLAADNQACEGQFWTILYQRAALKMMGVDYTNWATVYGMGGRQLADGLMMLTGKSIAVYTPSVAAKTDNFETLRLALQAGKPVTAASTPNAMGISHAFSVLKANAATKSVTIRNPYGATSGASLEIVELPWAEFVKRFRQFATTA